MSTSLAPLSHTPGSDLADAVCPRVDGRVASVVGLLIEGYCPSVAVGDLIQIHGETGTMPAEVVGLRDGRVLMVALGDVRGITIGSRLRRLGRAASVACGDGLLGRVLDGRGKVVDTSNGPVLGPMRAMNIYRGAPGPLERELIDEPLSIGLRVLDGLLTLGRGQRIGINAGAGVGKSTMLGAIAQQSAADVNVIGLIGERGREVGEFLHRTLSPEARARSVVIVATSDQSPLERMRGAFVATTVAEHFASSGKQVLLMMDSITRFAMAQRELGLSMGEPPATRGYTPSVFAMLPRLLERAGRFQGGGSITGVYTVLVQGDDQNDPIGDAARSILDGHIVLSRALAARGHYPAVDVLHSVSRVMDSIVSSEHRELAVRFRQLLASLQEGEDLMQMGAYVPGADPDLDFALTRKTAILEFLQQDGNAGSSLEQTVEGLRAAVERPT